MRHKNLAIIAATCVALASGASAAVAETIQLGTDLSPKNEIPPNNSTASGKAEVTWDTVTSILTWRVTFQGLTGPVIGAHIHGPGPSNSNAGVMIGFTTGESPIEGSIKLDEAKAKAVLNGQTYVNVHTQAHPGGEIRGHLMRK